MELLDRCWMELAYALVGEQLDVGDDICGAGKERLSVLTWKRAYCTVAISVSNVHGSFAYNDPLCSSICSP